MRCHFSFSSLSRPAWSHAMHVPARATLPCIANSSKFLASVGSECEVSVQRQASAADERNRARAARIHQIGCLLHALLGSTVYVRRCRIRTMRMLR